MFSGIVSHLGRVSGRELLAEGALRLAIQAPPSDRGPLGSLELGESIAVNGACLTVTERWSERDASGVECEHFCAFVSSETLACTTLGSLRVDTQVNLERSLRVGDRLSGHWVQGHVDGIGRVQSISAEAGAWRMQLSLSEALRRLCVRKGSIAIQGVSLTINALSPPGTEAWVSVMLIPHTWTHTTLGSLTVGDPVQIETDVLGKQIIEYLAHYAVDTTAPSGLETPTR